MGWQDDYTPGAIIAYLMRPDNAPHHTGPIGRWISYALSYAPHLDNSITHVGIVRGMITTPPEPGFTQLNVVDTLDGFSVGDRQTERNYAIEVYKLRKGLILNVEPRITSDDLAKKALEVADKLKGIRYNRWKLLDTMWFHYSEENEKVDSNYTKRLCDRFHVNAQRGSFAPDTGTETLICPEFVISSYQIAWLLLAGESATNKPFPEWININARTSTAALVDFLRHSPFYEPVSAESNHALRYSGTRHPNDGDETALNKEPLGYSTVRFSISKYLPHYIDPALLRSKHKC